MKFEWRDRIKYSFLVCEETFIVGIEEYEDKFYVESSIFGVLINESIEFDTMKDAQQYVENRLREFCTAFNTWWYREDKK